jgi:hypothetical protein
MSTGRPTEELDLIQLAAGKVAPGARPPKIMGRQLFEVERS